MSRRLAPAIMVLLLACLALAGGVLGTHRGVGIWYDSIVYLNLIGTRTGAGAYAPMYTWVLSLFSSPANVMDAARWMSVTLLVLNVLLVWFMLFRAVRSSLLAFATALLVLSSKHVLNVHLYAQSEGLFVFFVLIALMTLSRYLETGRMAFFLVAGLSTGAATLTRFAGVPLIAVGFLSVLLFSHRSWRERLTRAVGLGVIGAAPLAAWVLYSVTATGSSGTGREMAFLGNADTERFRQGVHALANFFVPTLPAKAEIGLLVVLAAVLTGLTYKYARAELSHGGVGQQRREYALLPLVLALFVVLYLAFLVLSVFIEANLPLYARYMVPAYVVIVPLLTILIYRVLFSGRSLRIAQRGAVALLVASLAVTSTARAGKWIADAYQEGLGYASRTWRESPIIAEVKKLDPSTLVYSNAADAILVLTGRHTRYIPTKYVMRTGKAPSVPFLTQMEAMRADLVRNGGVVVFLDGRKERAHLASEKDLLTDLSLEQVMAVRDGRIYRLAEHGARSTGAGPAGPSKEDARLTGAGRR